MIKTQRNERYIKRVGEKGRIGEKERKRYKGREKE